MSTTDRFVKIKATPEHEYVEKDCELRLWEPEPKRRKSRKSVLKDAKEKESAK